mmetsp:Transcript_34681/g.62956  ORF Transcript_34681/g.62956 Transcript_34681/m.62956 type:complete len:96 (-) Transcript_34681:8-295(-)
MHACKDVFLKSSTRLRTSAFSACVDGLESIKPRRATLRKTSFDIPNVKHMVLNKHVAAKHIAMMMSMALDSRTWRKAMAERFDIYKQLPLSNEGA